MKSGPDPKQAAATLRLAAPIAAEAIRNDTMEEEKALKELAQTGVTIEEMNRIVREVRGKQATASTAPMEAEQR